MSAANGTLPDSDFTRENLSRAHERYLSHLSNVVSGGLTVDAQGELPPEQAMMRVAGALLKAVVVSTFAESDGEYLDADGWTADSTTLSKNEQHDALCGIVALLQGAPVILEELRRNGEFREGNERLEHVEARHEAHIRLAGERAIEAEDNEPDGAS